jgi:signal transduction histidine kinase
MRWNDISFTMVVTVIRHLRRLRPRSLGSSVLAMLALGFLLLTATQYYVIRAYMERQLLEVESRDAFARLRSLHHAMAQLEEDLESTTADWSQWDSAYEYTTHQDPNFAIDNLDPGTIQRLRLDFVLIIDADGKAIFAHGVSADGTALTELPKDIIAMAEGKAALSGAADPKKRMTGLISAGGTVYLLSSQPVLMSVVESAPAGRMIMGRTLEGFVLPTLQRVTGETLQFGPLTTPVERRALLKEENGDALMLHSERLVGFTPLRDLSGRPIVQLQMKMERPMQTMLTEARQYLLASTLIVGVVFCTFIVLLLRRLLVQPIEQLAANAVHLGQDGEASARIEPVSSTRELATLTDAVNAMLARLEQQRSMQRDRDAAVEANRLKSEFLATMSHEIRTPMNGVLGMCELLQRTELSARQRHLSDTILRSGRSLLGILNDVLDFSKIESGKLDIECAPFSPAELVQTVSAPFLASAQAKNLEFSVRMEPGVPQMVMGDALRLRQILNNLLSNAMKFTERGSVSISCAGLAGTDNVQLRFTVVDTGIGISPAAQQQIFDPFAQAASDTSRRFGGTGLGLAIVRQLVSLLGGTIDLRSELGQGSTFAFTVSVQAMQATHALPRHEMTGAHLRVDYAPHVLLAEDNEVNREVFSEMLEHLGCRVTAVANGALAVAATATTSFDAILMDCQMPVMDGHAATAQVRAHERKATQKRSFIVALTADATPENRQRCLDAGMDTVATKPISQSALRDLIVSAVRRAQAV